MASVNLGLTALLTCLAACSYAADQGVIWTMGDLKKIGGVATQVVGAPRVFEGAIVFDGVKDGIFVPTIPLAGAAQFTIEILFRPGEGGPEAQRFFHLQDTSTWRVMIETRLDGRRRLVARHLSGIVAGRAAADRSEARAPDGPMVLGGGQLRRHDHDPLRERREGAAGGKG
jgi:hypothetical protein